MKLKMKKKLVKKVHNIVPQKIEAEGTNDVPIEAIDLDTKHLNEVLEKALGISERCTDYNVSKASPKTMRLNDDLSLVYKADGGVERECSFSKFALSQFGSKIGVPANYLEKCVNNGRPEIAQYNVNAWLDGFNKPLFIREYQDENGNDTIRGVLSDRYAICDTPDIIDGIDRVLDLERFKIKGSFVAPDRFHLRVAERTKMKVSGEDLFGGLSIDSSDVGRSTLRVNFLVYKQICTNGLIVSKGSTQLFKQKHIGITADAFKLGLEEGFEMFPKICASVEKSIEKTRNCSNMFNFSYEDDEQLADLVKGIQKQTSLSPVMSRNVVDIMNSGRYEDNRWGYINALTEVAQMLTLEKRINLEDYAGRLLVA